MMGLNALTPVTHDLLALLSARPLALLVASTDNPFPCNF